MKSVRQLLISVQEIQPYTLVYSSKAWYFFSISSGKKEPPAQIRQLAYHIGHFLLKSEFQTLVELINNKYTHCRCIYIAFFQMVVHTSRSTDNHRRTDTFHCAVFVHGRTSAIATHYLEVSTHSFEDLFYLQCQLA